MIRRHFRVHGFTMIEVFVVLMLIGILIVLLLPSVQSAREAARRNSCANNFMQIGLAIQSYHFAFDQLPTPLSGTDGSTVEGEDNDRRLSFLVALLPFIDQTPSWEMIHQPLDRDEFAFGSSYGMMGDNMYSLNIAEESVEGEDAESEEKVEPWVAGGPEPFAAEYYPWASEPVTYRCPSDPGVGIPAMGRTNYAACLGDGVVASDSGPFKEVNGHFVYDEELAAQTNAAMRGMFVPRMVMRLRDTTDGLAHTIMLGEIATDLGDMSVRTRAAAGPGADVLRDEPSWARSGELIDGERPEFWMQANTKLYNTREWGRGYRWADGMPLYTGFNTILPPNRELVLRDDRDDCWGILPSSSRHQGGANVCFGDGSIRFITDSVDAGDSDQPTVYLGSANPPGSESPYGLWGALGTRASGELKWRN